MALRSVTGNDHLSAIARLDKAFKRARIDYWLFGGWAVDFHVGHVTREHGDIDIAVWQSDLAAVDGLLAADGWTHTAASDEDGYTTYEQAQVHLDVAFLELHEHALRPFYPECRVRARDLSGEPLTWYVCREWDFPRALDQRS
jgi:hypothetical protein